MEAVNLACSTCTHFRRFEKIACLAFPEGIPEEIIIGYNDHTAPVEGQVNDFLYDPEPWAAEVKNSLL